MVALKQNLTIGSKKILLNSLLWSGLGFMLIGGLSILFAYLINRIDPYIVNSQNYLIGASLSCLVFSIIAVIINFKWSFNVINASWTTITLAWFTYVVLYTGILAPLISILNNSYYIFLALGIAGIIYIISGIFGYCFMNDKFAFSMTKIIMITFFVMMISQMIFIFPMFFLVDGFLWWNILISLLFGIMTVVLISLNFYRISKSEEFSNYLDSNQINKLGLFYGLQLLILFINLFIMLIRFIIAFKN